MAHQIFVERAATDRLLELGLSVEIIGRAVRRAEAEASLCTPLDPPILQGLTRWGRTTRFLREELIPAGWLFDNPYNLSRTIHPSGDFAIVATSGDALTASSAAEPTTKYPKGYATVRAVAVNEQLTFDLGLAPESDGGYLLTWFLLTYVDTDAFHIELSLPDAIVDGWITGWAERILLPPFPREANQSVADAPPPNNDDGEDGSIVVEVSRR